MSTNLKEYFPMIREREEVLEEIEKDIRLKRKYESWLPEEQSNFLSQMLEQKSDTGLEMELLQKYLFISLGIFRKNEHNTDEIKKRDAWLLLFSDDNPNTIIELTDKYPEFRGIYEEGYEICRNTERVMDMFSKELYKLDKNTVQYMIDEMQDTINRQENTINAQENN